MKAILPKNEAVRLKALHDYKVLDTEPEADFDALTRLAAYVCETPIALISLLDTDRQWFKSKVGLSVWETPREIAFCNHAILQQNLLVVPDALADERFAENPLVLNDPNIRFYAGAPLITPEGLAIGTICVIDYIARDLKPEQKDALQVLSQQVISHLERRRKLPDLTSTTTALKIAAAENLRQAQGVASVSNRELRWQEALLRSMTSASPLAFYVVDNHTDEILYFNHRFCEIWGIEHLEEQMQRGKLKNQDIIPYCLPMLAEVPPVSSSKPLQREVNPGVVEDEITFVDGRIIRRFSTQIPDEQDRYFGRLYLFEDITQRKHSEKTLEESEERFHTMADTAPVMIWMAGTDKLCHYFNKGWLEFTGRTLEQELGNGWVQGVHPEDLQVCLDTYINAFDARRAFKMEYRLRRFDGEYRWILDAGTPRFNADGSFTGYIGSCIDVTQSKQAAEKIQEQAALLDVTTDAIFVRDLNNQILFWNKGAERLYGWQAQEVTSSNAIALLSKDLAQFEEAMKTVTSLGEWSGELSKVTKSGKKIIVESRWTLMRDRLGQPKSILCVDTDITEKKQLALQFLRAQRLESIGTLASGIAHDLNNVLAPILMTAQLLQMKIADERSQNLLKTLESNAKRGAALIKQVLSFARGVEGKHTTLQLRHLIAEIKQITKQTFPKSIEISTNIPSNLWSVTGDATQLDQVLMNLCVNARDAMPNGGSLRITAENISLDENYARMHLEAKVGTYIVITVADTGMGMPREIRERIFEPFFTTKELGKGTGLGLSTVVGIVKSHGGFVNVYSELERGTQFQVYLPAVETIESQAVGELEPGLGNGELILVVDDEAAIRESTKTYLETYNYKVMTASDGIEAIAVYVQHRAQISLVVIDLMMPTMDGPTTIRTLQKLNPQVKIVAVSGLASNTQVASAGNGVKAFLSKPYTTQELLKTINELL